MPSDKLNLSCLKTDGELLHLRLRTPIFGYRLAVWLFK